MSKLRGYMEQMAAMNKTMGHRPMGGFYSIEEFVLRHGREFAWKRGAGPAGVPMDGEPNACYMNAANLMLSRRDLLYVEGYAHIGQIPIPTHHAWCSTFDGVVVDPTWDSDRLLSGPTLGALASLRGAREYIGIPINRVYLVAALIRRKMWGIMNDWEYGWPMLSDAPSDWLDDKVKLAPGVAGTKGRARLRRTLR
jgi:hypothetical protein